MTAPTTREQFKDWCLRELGHPVVEINVDDDQVEDRIDEAFQFYRDFHHDSMERWYSSHQLTADDITNKYLSVADNVYSIQRIFPLVNATTVNMFDMRYQLRLHDLYDFSSTSMVNYTLTMQHLRLIEMLFIGEAPVRHNRNTNRLRIDWDWTKCNVGDWVVMEGFMSLDPETYTKVYNDRMLKKYATALIKKQWGTNMKKFTGMKLPGGIEMNGQKIYDEAVAEIKELEDSIRDEYETPPIFFMG